MKARFFAYDLMDTPITVLWNYGIELANPGPVMFKEAACVNGRNIFVREDLVEQIFEVARYTFHLCRRDIGIPPFKEDADVFLQYLDMETSTTLEKNVRSHARVLYFHRQLTSSGRIVGSIGRTEFPPFARSPQTRTMTVVLNSE